MTFLKQYWKSILVFCFIFYVSILHIPVMHLPKIPHQDKLIHFIMYFTLSSVIYRDIIQTQAQLKKIFLVLFVLALPILYGGIIELLQGAFFPPRKADWLDFLTNAVGSSLAFLLTPFLILRKKKV